MQLPGQSGDQVVQAALAGLDGDQAAVHGRAALRVEAVPDVLGLVGQPGMSRADQSAQKSGLPRPGPTGDHTDPAGVRVRHPPHEYAELAAPTGESAAGFVGEVPGIARVQLIEERTDRRIDPLAFRHDAVLDEPGIGKERKLGLAPGRVQRRCRNRLPQP